MAVALASTTAREWSGYTSVNMAVTVPTGDNRLLLVCIALNHDNRADTTVSSMTFFGQSLTKTDNSGDDMVASQTDARVEIWKLAAPAVGTNNLNITLAAAANISVVATVWTGVHQTVPLGEFTGGTGSSTSPSVTVTSATDEIVVDVLSASGNNPTATIGSGQTSLQNSRYYNTSSGNDSHAAASYETGAASTVMSWTLSVTCAWAQAGVPIKPVTAGGGGGTTPPTPPSGATLGIGLAEVGIVPKRASPDFSPVTTGSSTYNVLENQQGDWEASGMFPKVLQGTLVGDQIIWDDIYTIPSVAPAGAICISALPTQNSPTQSLLVATQNLLVQYPLPVSGSPTTTAYPQLPIAVTSTTQAQAPESLLPIFYPSAFDSGGRVLELVAVQCVGQNFTDEVDAWAISVRPDDTEPWSTTVRQKSAEALFWMTSGNYGRVWRLAAQILDGDQDDPIGPSGSQIIGWFREVKVDPATYSQRARAVPEVS